ncbi:MAG TPA: hypothetical protein VFX20_18140 [Steroidobacteraceae bacterium]|nr:hypothetical protein [Steroidobacteraceae bacterium]
MSTPKRLSIPGAGKVEPWRVPDYDLADAAALQAVYHGRGTEDQQRRAYLFIVQKLCAIGELSFRPPDIDPDGRTTAFAEGKRFVGQQLVKFAELNLDVLREKNPVTGKPKPTEQPT